jgi:hypothetical protein
MDEHHLHIEKYSYPGNRPGRPILNRNHSEICRGGPEENTAHITMCSFCSERDGSDVSQAVSCRCPIARTWFEPGSSHVGSVVDRQALGHVFAECFCFPCHSFIPLTAPQSPPAIMQGWYNRPINGRSDSGLGSTPVPQINRQNT